MVGVCDRSMERRNHRLTPLLVMFSLRGTRRLLLLTVTSALLLLVLPTPLAFPLAAVFVAPTASAFTAASASGLPVADVTVGGSLRRRGWELKWRRHQRLQQHHRPRAHGMLNKPLASRGLVGMALPSRPASVAIFAAGMVFGCCISSPVSANFRLYRTVPDIPKSMFKDHASLKGNVVSVSDGDSIRVRHTPNVPLPLPGRKMEGKKKSDETLQIRLYAVDCPEIAHFGNPAQPFSAEAKAFTKDAIQGKPVKIKLLRMDQYNRAVCRVEYGRWPFRKDISAELLKNGLGVVYRQGGAEYDGREEKLTEYENAAKSRKEGLWAQSDGETPAQYKARIKREEPTGARK